MGAQPSKKSSDEETRANLITEAITKKCEGLKYSLRRDEVEEVMDRKKPPKSLQELIKAACLNRLEKMKYEKPNEYKEAIESVKKAGGHLPPDEEQKLKEEMKEEEKRMRNNLIELALNRECPGLDDPLNRKDLETIMKEKYPPTISDELVRRACIQRLETMKKYASLYVFYIKVYTDALASVKAAGGYLPSDADDQSVFTIEPESARSTAPLLK